MDLLHPKHTSTSGKHCGTWGTAAVATVRSARYEDFGAPATQASAQCALPISQRTGGWTCPDGATDTAAPASSGYCFMSGACWTVDNDFKAEFHTSKLHYGVGSTELGQEHLTIYWNLTGAQTLALPVQSRNTRSTTHTIYSGALYNGAKNASGGGNLIKACSPNIRGAAPADKLVSYPKGCKLYDKGKNYNHNMIIQVSWELPEHSGYWYASIRSPVAHAGDKASYRFATADDLPGSAHAQGYHA